MSKDSAEPLDSFAQRCNKMCNDLWRYIDRLTEHINTLPEGTSKRYLVDYKSTLGYIAELYFFNAVSLGTIRGLEEGVIKALYKEVFKDKSIQLPYEPKEGTTLRESMERYEKNESLIKWIDRDLNDKSLDLEKEVDEKKDGEDLNE